VDPSDHPPPSHVPGPSPNPFDKILQACRAAAGRELKEETGIDVTDELERLVPMRLLVEETVGGGGGGGRGARFPGISRGGRPSGPSGSELPLVVIEYKNRIFFNLRVTDEDFPRGTVTTTGAERLDCAGTDGMGGAKAKKVEGTEEDGKERRKKANETDLQVS